VNVENSLRARDSRSRCAKAAWLVLIAEILIYRKTAEKEAVSSKGEKTKIRYYHLMVPRPLKEVRG
jgi:hypothetical protein